MGQHPKTNTDGKDHKTVQGIPRKYGFNQYSPQFNTGFFLYKIARIPPFNTVFIRKTHFLPPEIQIKDPFFPIVSLYENNWVAKYID